MFSGIVETAAPVRAATWTGGSLVAHIDTGFTDLTLGESIAVNGVCLTVTAFDAAGTASFFLSPETIARSNLGRLGDGRVVNLERSVRLDTRLCGHMVQGHVDGKGRLVAVEPDSDARRIAVDIPAELGRYCVEKGSIALDGISLTINGLAPAGNDRLRVAVTIIPHTWDNTNLRDISIGDEINVEVDVFAKYVEKLCLPYLTR